MTSLLLGAAAATLTGTWAVDLRPTPDSPAYQQSMMLAVAADGALTGSFYGAPIAAGRAATSNGRTCFASSTSDGSGAYQHPGCLAGDGIDGLSWAQGRGFLLAWRAARVVSTPARP